MDRLASCHLMHGFIHIPNQRGRHPSSPNCQNIKASHRSLSLVDRRGLVSPARNDRRGFMSSQFRHQLPVRNEFDERRQSMKKIHDMNLIMQIMDFDRFTSDDSIGEIVLPMKNVNFNKEPVYWKKSQKPTVNMKQISELMITLCYLPLLNKLDVNVYKAQNLPSSNKFGNCDSYVKLWLVQKGQEIEKRKTSVRTQTVMPIFNENFTFDKLPNKTVLLSEVNLVVTVMGFDSISSNDEIGHVVIGMLGNNSGVCQWQDTLQNAEMPSTTWHRLTQKW